LRTDAGLARSACPPDRLTAWLGEGGLRWRGAVVCRPEGWLRLDALVRDLTGTPERCKLLAGNSLSDMVASLNERERQVLEAVIETYVETAEPAGSRTISKRFGHTLSAATIRNTMSDLEEKGISTTRTPQRVASPPISPTACT